jgi:hypothetical protein
MGTCVMKSLVGLLESCFGGGIVRHTLILFHGYLVSSTLPVVSSFSTEFCTPVV